MTLTKFTFMAICLLCYCETNAQSNFGLAVASSKNDNHMETVWYQHQLSSRFSAGIQLRNSDVRYRFVNARAIENGNTFFAGITLGYKIAHSENYRLDANLTTSYRYLENEKNPSLPQITGGLEMDPNLILSLRLKENLCYHSGALLRTTSQISPESIGDEQLPSAILLNGFSLQKKSSTFSLRTYVGPMNGASGDTEKFFWQVSVGYQFNLKFKESKQLPFINF